MGGATLEPDAIVEAAVAVGACGDCARLVVALVVGAGAGAAPAGVVEPDVLTARERAVLSLLAQGLSAAQIAHRLEISSATVRKHLEHLYGKLGVHDRLSAAMRARERGLLADAAP